MTFFPALKGGAKFIGRYGRKTSLVGEKFFTSYVFATSAGRSADVQVIR